VEKLFQIIMEEVSIDEESFEAELTKQQWSYDKKRVLTLLLLQQ